MDDDAESITPLEGEHITNIVTWLCLVIATFSIASRFAVKWAVARKFGLDDGLVVVAFIFNLLSGLAVTFEVCNGLDMPFTQLSTQTLKTQLLSAYMARISYLAALTFAKLSIVAFIRHISPVTLHRGMTTGLAAFIGLVWIAETITVALQCSPPQPWDFIHSKCLNLRRFWYFVGGMNIFTDLCLVFLAFWVMKDLQMPRRKKFVVLGSFAARLVDVAVTAVQIMYASAFQNTTAKPHMWEFVMSTQIVQCVTIVTSCIPYLRGLLESLPSGMYLSDELRRRALHSRSTPCVQISSYAMNNFEGKKCGNVNSPKRQSRVSTGKVPHASTLSSIFTRIDITQHDSESAEHINAETRLSRSVTISTTAGRPREHSQGEMSLTAPPAMAPEAERTE